MGLYYALLGVGDYLYKSYYYSSVGYIKRISLSNPQAGEQHVFDSNNSPYNSAEGVLSMVEKDGFLYAALYTGGKIMKLNFRQSTVLSYFNKVAYMLKSVQFNLLELFSNKRPLNFINTSLPSYYF